MKMNELEAPLFQENPKSNLNKKKLIPFYSILFCLVSIEPLQSWNLGQKSRRQDRVKSAAS